MVGNVVSVPASEWSVSRLIKRPDNIRFGPREALRKRRYCAMSQRSRILWSTDASKLILFRQRLCDGLHHILRVLRFFHNLVGSTSPIENNVCRSAFTSSLAFFGTCVREAFSQSADSCRRASFHQPRF